MGGIREFCAKDIQDVAALWAKTFRKRGSVSSVVLESYFEEVFLSNPWRSADLPSFVYEDSGGQIAGFLGVIPRAMRFNGTRIRVAIASQLMVDRSKPSAFVSLEMLRTLFAGPQDLTYSDGANESAQKVWEAAGGNVALLYSSVWTRLLRPARYLVSRCENRNLFTSFAKVSRPICWALDATAVRMRRGPYWLAALDGIEEGASDEMIYSCIRNLATDRALRPEYDFDSFQWLLQRASEQQTHGQLRRAIVRDAKGKICGWYLYYVKRGGISQVLQIGGTARSIEHVLVQLFYHAWREGAVAVSGQVDPKFALDLARNHSGFNWSRSVLVHSRNDEIVNAIHRGDAFLTRLEGEWWMRFCDFSDIDSDKQNLRASRPVARSTAAAGG